MVGLPALGGLCTTGDYAMYNRGLCNVWLRIMRLTPDESMVDANCIYNKQHRYGRVRLCCLC